MFLGTIVINGSVAGTWKRELSKSAVRVIATRFRRFTRTEASALDLLELIELVLLSSRPI
jgi:hypothetical protein